MKVIHLLASPYFSGPAELVLQLALTQRSLGHEVEVAVDRRRRETLAEELAVTRFEAHGLLSKRPLELSVKSSPLAFLRDVSALRGVAAQVDIVHSHFSHDHLVARCAGAPRVIRSIHAPRSLRWSTPRALGWTAPNEDLARTMLGRDVVVWPAMVDPSFVPPPKSRTSSARIGMVSTFQPSRRHGLGLAAFALVKQRLPSATLDLIGDGVLEAALRAQAAPLGESVVFRGYQSGAAFIKALQSLDEVWVLGLGNDFSGRAAAQARACGARVIAVDEGALAKWADVVVTPEAESIARVALGPERREVRLEAHSAVAGRVLELYERARKAAT